MRVLVMTKGDFEKGSTKYRIAQYADFLRTSGVNGINLDFVKRRDIDRSLIDRVRGYDTVFNQRCLIRTSLARKIIANSRRVIFDFDDAIYTRSGKPRSWLTSVRVRRRLHLWLRRANVVTTANDFLAEYGRRYSSDVVIIPMAIDLDTWRHRGPDRRDTFTIGWAGSPVNVRHIERLEPVLSEVLATYPFIRLAIFSGRKPQLSCPFEYYPFRPGEEPEFVRNLDIGLLPLSDEEYSMGKSPIKAIQYLACGVPVVGNVFGATAEILNDNNSICVSSKEDWICALATLIKNRELAESMGRAGREFVLKYHNAKLTAQRLLKIVSGDRDMAENGTNQIDG